jgi:hypothetical protein
VQGELVDTQATTIVPDGWVSRPDGTLQATPSRMLPGSVEPIISDSGQNSKDTSNKNYFLGSHEKVNGLDLNSTLSISLIENRFDSRTVVSESIWSKDTVSAGLRFVMNGSRNIEPLSPHQSSELVAYAKKLGATDEMIRVTDNMNTAYGNMFGMEVLYIGTDALPLPNAPQSGKTANSRMTPKSVIAHELIGHRRAAQAGREFDTGTPENINRFNLALDEAQASIRAAKFAPDLTSTERYTLLRDGINRLRNEDLKIKDVRHLLWIDEE